MITVVLSFDNLGEATALERGTWNGEVPLGADPSVIVALPRLLDELDSLGLRASFCVEAINCDLNSGAVRQIAGRGHELVAHGWRHEEWAEVDPGREAGLLHRSRAAFEQLSLPVVGFRPPGGGLTTAGPVLLLEHGFRWCSPAREAVTGRLTESASTGQEPAPAWIPFDWELVDAYWLMERFADLRARRGASRTPATAPEAARRLSDALLGDEFPEPRCSSCTRSSCSAPRGGSRR